MVVYFRHGFQVNSNMLVTIEFSVKVFEIIGKGVSSLSVEPILRPWLLEIETPVH